MKVEPVLYGDRKVYTVSAFNRGISRFLGRLPAVWVEGEVTELRRNAAWATVFLTLKDPKTGASLKVTIARSTYDRLELGLAEGETVHAAGRAELYELKGELGLRASTLERIGVGGHLVALERLKRELAAEGLFAPERKRRLPRVPRAVGILTGADAAARGDLLTTIGRRFPPTKAIVCETRVQGRGAPEAIVDGPARARGTLGGRRRRSHARRRELRGSAAVQRRRRWSVPSRRARCPSSPRSGTNRTRRSATSRPTRVRRHRQRRPRSSSRTCMSSTHLSRRAATGSTRSIRNLLAHDVARIERLSDRLRAAPRLLLERRRAALDHSAARLHALSPLATLARGYAIVRAGGDALREASSVSAGRPARDRARRRPARGARRGRATVNEAASFEELQKELEDVVARLERGDVAVDDAIALFRRGEELYRACVERLRAAELRIEELTSSDGQTP